VDAVLLALCSAALFGGMTVALRFGLHTGASAEVGAALTILPAFAIALVAALVEVARNGAPDLAAVLPFLLAGIVAPGGSQILFTLAIDAAGPSRTSVLVGSAPLVAAAIALVLLDEPLQLGLVVGALLIVAGGGLLIGERVRPESFRLVGYAFALGCTILFASRDNLLRWLSLDGDVAPSVATAATLGAGTVVVVAFALIRVRGRPSFEGAGRFATAGVFFGLSYIALFEAYYRGRVTVVSPLVATESLWGVLLSALLIGRSELIGRNLLGGAALIVAGGALIGAFR
jgi:drug/metabolite transporter, DME family